MLIHGRYKDPKKLRHHLHGFSAGHGARDDGSLTRAALERCLADLNIGLTPAEPRRNVLRTLQNN